MNQFLTQWNQLKNAWLNDRIPQAMLFVGPPYCVLTGFVTQLIQLMLCKSDTNKPCLTCPDCCMISRNEHPDTQWVLPEKNGGIIKIDQIRDLQYSAYLTPQRSKHRFIIIEAADRMNTASANAVLKILEEPAKHTIFILLANQLSTVLPTVLSRCQITPFYLSDNHCDDNLLLLGSLYPEGTERATLINQADVILDSFIALIKGQENPCSLAAQLNEFELDSILWFLYLVYSQLHLIHLGKSVSKGPAIKQLQSLVLLINPLTLYSQLDKITALLKKLSQNISINQTLALETLLFSLISD
ncbi:MAG: DNA polymerase III subunit delta' [Legionella sp.]|nr:DNA polymerase III subunit delta' [Legionella sp.]